MNIIFVITHLTVFVGGGKFLMEYANQFCEHGHNVTVVSQKINFDIYKFNPLISIIEVGGPLPTNPLHWLLFPVIKSKYLQVLKKLSADIMISTGFPANLFCSVNSRYNGIKHIYYCLEPFRYFHDRRFYSTASFFPKNTYRLLGMFFKRYDIEGVQAANKIICISNFTKKQVEKIYNRDSQVHHIGIDLSTHSRQISPFDFYQKIKLNDNSAPIIFTLGMVHHLKGERELITIFHKIIQKIPNTVLLIGGWRAKRNEKIMKKLVNKLKIPQDNIIFYGFIEQHLLDAFYQNSTITVYTAIDESYGYIPIESMKNGTPVVAFEGGPSDTILDGKTGYVIKNIDLNDFAQKVIKLLLDRSLREKFSENAKLHVKNNFNREKSFSNLETILQEAILNK